MRARQWVRLFHPDGMGIAVLRWIGWGIKGAKFKPAAYTYPKAILQRVKT